MKEFIIGFAVVVLSLLSITTLIAILGAILYTIKPNLIDKDDKWGSIFIGGLIIIAVIVVIIAIVLISYKTGKSICLPC